MGTGNLYQGGRWYFSGRNEVLRYIVRWLAEPVSDGMARVLTGDPGAGKSAVLGFLVTSGDEHQGLDPNLAAFLKTMPPGTTPKPGCVNFAINLRDRTLDATLEILADHLRSSPDEVVKLLANRQEKTVLVFDGLEEAAEPVQIAEQILRPLIGYQHLWLIIGLRRPELPRLGDSIVPLDLDSDMYRSTDDVALYVERILLGHSEIRNSPYRNNRLDAQRSARAVAEAAQGNFLVAFIIARSLLERPCVLDPDHERLPRTTEEAFSEYLLRLGERSRLGEGRLRRALIPLAYAQGEGLPRDVWAKLTVEDIENLLNLARAFIPEYEEDGHLVYRLYHQALAEALRVIKHEVEEHRSIAERLLAAIPKNDWLHADWYTRRYLARHAARAMMLDGLLADTAFLAVADQRQLLGVIDQAALPEARRRASWYRLSATRFRDTNTAERLSYLGLVALEHGALDLALTTELGLKRPWHARWAQFAPPTPHLAIQAYVTHVKFLVMNDNVIASASLGMSGWVNLWDLRTGSLLLKVENGSEITALALSEHILACATAEIVRIFDRATNKLITEITIDEVEAMAIAQNYVAIARKGGMINLLDWRTSESAGPSWKGYTGAEGHIVIDGETIVSGSVEERVFRRWNIATGDLISEYICRAEIKPDALAIGKDAALYQDWPTDLIQLCNLKTGSILEGPKIPHPTCLAIADVAAIGDTQGTIYLWDPNLGSGIHQQFDGHQAAVSALTIGRQIVVSGGRDGFIRIWDRHCVPIGRSSPLATFGDTRFGNLVNSIAIIGDPLPPPGPQIVTPHKHITDGNLVAASADGTMTILNEETGELWAQVHKYGTKSSSEWWEAEAHSVTASEELIVSAFRWGILAWSRRTGEPVDLPLRQFIEHVTNLATDDGFLVTLSELGHVHLWDSHTGVSLGEIDAWRELEIKSIAAVGDIVVSGDSKGKIRFWDVRAQASVDRTISLSDSAPEDFFFPPPLVAVAATGQIVAAMTSSGSVYVWDRRTFQLVGQPHESRLLATNPQLEVDYIATGYTRKGEVHVMTALTVRGDIVAFGTGFGLGLWNAATRSLLKIRLGSPVNSVAIKDSSVYVACFDGILRLDIL
jgi:WD40 repeat protein